MYKKNRENQNTSPAFPLNKDDDYDDEWCFFSKPLVENLSSGSEGGRGGERRALFLTFFHREKG